MGYFGKSDTDLGECASLICPHCHKLSRFKLLQVKSALRFLGVPLLEFDRLYQIACNLCDFRKDLNARELLAAMRAKRLFKEVSCGKIAPKDYLEALNRLSFPSLHDLRKSAQSWICPACSESVPEDLQECWKCRAAKSSVPAGNGEQVLPPELPWQITRPTNPWER